MRVCIMCSGERRGKWPRRTVPKHREESNQSVVGQWDKWWCKRCKHTATSMSQIKQWQKTVMNLKGKQPRNGPSFTSNKKAVCLWQGQTAAALEWIYCSTDSSSALNHRHLWAQSRAKEKWSVNICPPSSLKDALRKCSLLSLYLVNRCRL